MPHLSPMSWLSALLMFWLVCLIITSTSWWNCDHKFHISGLSKIQPSSTSWMW